MERILNHYLNTFYMIGDCNRIKSMVVSRCVARMRLNLAGTVARWNAVVISAKPR